MYPYGAGMAVLDCSLLGKSFSYCFTKVRRPAKNLDELVTELNTSIMNSLQPIAGYFGAMSTAGGFIHRQQKTVLRYTHGHTRRYLCYPEDREPEFTKTEEFR